jgi:hypothetical protein
MKSHSTFYSVPWVLKENNDILGFPQSILHVISSTGHLLAWSHFSVLVFFGPLLEISFVQFSFSCPLHVGISKHYFCSFRLQVGSSTSFD